MRFLNPNEVKAFVENIEFMALTPEKFAVMNGENPFHFREVLKGKEPISLQMLEKMSEFAACISVEEMLGNEQREINKEWNEEESLILTNKDNPLVSEKIKQYIKMEEENEILFNRENLTRQKGKGIGFFDAHRESLIEINYMIDLRIEILETILGHKYIRKAP